ncbi:MAG: leucine-rich repeat domain-containing protein [Clostridium butyricum]|nr:leucine-rich repeat domain-containing protein [Clostridium butyricum]
MKKVSMKEGIEVIGRNAFANCFELKNAKIPSTVKELGVQAFEPSSATQDTNNSGTSEGLVISDGVLLSGKDAKGDVVIPDGVTKIAERAFYNNQNIISVKIPKTVTEMGKTAFAGSSIKSVEIPGSIKNIAYTAFEHCTKLEEVEIGEGVQTIGEKAFSQCGRIKKINLPSSVTKIESGAFRGCNSLETFDYGENIVVKYAAFLGTKFDGVIVSRGNVSEESTEESTKEGTGETNDNVNTSIESQNGIPANTDESSQVKDCDKGIALGFQA